MKKIKYFLSVMLFSVLTLIFIKNANADVIVITVKRPNHIGHTSIISQDKNGKWFYFYWGNEVAYAAEVPNEYMKNIDTLNEWFFINRKSFEKSSRFYAYGTYIKGDFTKSTEYYNDVVKNYKTWKYNFIFNNCSTVSQRALEKGILLNGKPFKSQIKYKLKEYIPFWSIFPHNYRKIIERNFIGTEHHAFPDWGKVTDEKILSLINGTYKSSKK